MKKQLPIGKDDFRKVRESNCYYVDKSLMIRDFIEKNDEVALITRPRRFGKTLNMTMLKEFFDICENSRALFEGLEIMNTPYAEMLNTRPVIYFTFKNCRGATVEELVYGLRRELLKEYLRYEPIVRERVAEEEYSRENFYKVLSQLKDNASPFIYLSSSIADLTGIVCQCFGSSPVLLIDEYDQPIISSYEYGYHDEMGAFFSNFYGQALKGNQFLGQALLTGIQRVAKESIFSQLNNPKIYTVWHKQYAPYFGLTEEETERLLADNGLKLDEQVRQMYDGYRFGDREMYNPWSILNYADTAFPDNYWVNTSSNFFIKTSLAKANKAFWDDFDKLASGEKTTVWLNLDTFYAERESNYSLWGLLVNAGYVTIYRRIDASSAIVKIPNREVMSEFLMIVTELGGIEGQGLQELFHCLLHEDFERFIVLYQELVIACTSYMDARENAYHMLFLGMCMSLIGSYKVTSNLENGLGRSDITLEALRPGNINVIIEFKQGADVDLLKKEALRQIMDKKYYTGLKGKVLCIGLAHDKKNCGAVYEMLEI